MQVVRERVGEPAISQALKGVPVTGTVLLHPRNGRYLKKPNHGSSPKMGGGVGQRVADLKTLPVQRRNVRSCLDHSIAVPSFLCIWGGSSCHKNNGGQNEAGTGLCRGAFSGAPKHPGRDSTGD